MRFIRDLRYACRVLRKDAAFTLVAVLSLALGTGANSTMFSLINGMLLRPLGVSKPNEVWTVAPKDPDNPFAGLSYPDYVDVRDQSRTMTDLVGSMVFRFGFSASPEALSKTKYGLLVSGNLFDAMGVSPVLGRAFRPDEAEVSGRDAVVVLGNDFWKDEFAGDPNVIGRSIRLNGLDFTVIGVAPETFTGMDELIRAAMFVPVSMAPRFFPEQDRNPLVSRDWRDFTVKGRLKPGIGPVQAEAEIANISRNLAETYPASNANREMTLRTEMQMHLQHTPRESGFMVMSMIMAGLVLLASCFNVANLLLSRTRSREIGVRLALGAGRWRLVRQLLTECLVLATAGAILGLWFAWAGGLLFNTIKVPSDLPIIIDVRTDQRVLAFTMLSGFFSVLLFGLAPALHGSRVDLVPALKGTVGHARPKAASGRNLLVIAQISISIVLLVTVTIIYRGFKSQMIAGVGFRTNHIEMMTFDPRMVRYDDAAIREFYRRLLDQARASQQVKSVAMSATIPLAINQRAFTVEIAREGSQYAKTKQWDHVLNNVVDEHFFDTMAIPIVKGRGFEVSDKEDSPPVIIVNEVLAEKYWGKDDPIGKRVLLQGDDEDRWASVVGVARTSKYVWMTEAPTEYVYLPLSQNFRRQRILIAESFGDAASITTTLREMIRGIDPNMPIFDVRTMEEFFSSWVVGSANNALYIVTSMALTSLILSTVGLYGLVTYSVSCRTREFGIRIAVGAHRSRVLAMVLGQGARLCLTGIVVGVILSIPASRLLTRIVFSVSTDWTPYIVAPTLLMLITLLAAFGPARRASTIDPMNALRDE